MKLFLGFAGYCATKLCDDLERARRVASLLVDERWPWPPWWAQFWSRDKFLKSTRSRKVVGTKGQSYLAEGLTSPDYRRLTLYRSSEEAPRQIQRAIFVREKLGGTYVRHPQWGNYLGREHIAKIGGIERIRSEVASAQLIELGKLVFIGLTEDPRDALTAECERKRAVLESLRAPDCRAAACERTTDRISAVTYQLSMEWV